MGATDRGEDGAGVEGAEGAQIDDLGLDATAGEFVGCVLRLSKRAAVADQSEVRSCPADGSPIEVGRSGVFGQIAFQVVEAAVLEDQDRVGVADRGPQHAPRVLQRGRRDHPKPGNMGVPALKTVGMLGRQLAAGPCGHADDERNVELTTGHVQQGGGVVHDLVEGEQAEVDGHDLDDGAHAAEGGTDAGTHKRRLGQRGVADALGTELLQQAETDREAAAVAAHVLTHQEHPLIPAEGIAQCCSHRLAVGRLHAGRSL